MWFDDRDRGDRLLVSRQLRLETPVLFEREPLLVGPVPLVAKGLPRELDTVGAGVDGTAAFRAAVRPTIRASRTTATVTSCVGSGTGSCPDCLIFRHRNVLAMLAKRSNGTFWDDLMRHDCCRVGKL